MDVLVLDISREQESNIEQLNSIVITNQLNSAKIRNDYPVLNKDVQKKLRRLVLVPVS